MVPSLRSVLGRHLDAYLEDTAGSGHDDERRLADAILDVELRRTQKRTLNVLHARHVRWLTNICRKRASKGLVLEVLYPGEGKNETSPAGKIL